jgi:hypothetical protein
VKGGWDGWIVFDLLHEHLAPEVLFSVLDFSQVHCRAGCLPQEHLASWAQMQPPSRPQQVTGTAPVVVVEDIVDGFWLELVVFGGVDLIKVDGWIECFCWKS